MDNISKARTAITVLQDSEGLTDEEIDYISRLLPECQHPEGRRGARRALKLLNNTNKERQRENTLRFTRRALIPAPLIQPPAMRQKACTALPHKSSSKILSSNLIENISGAACSLLIIQSNFNHPPNFPMYIRYLFIELLT